MRSVRVHAAGDVHALRDTHTAVDAHIAIKAWHPCDVHVDFTGKINRGISPTTVGRAEKGSAVSANVVVVPILRQSKLSEIFFLAFVSAEDVCAVELCTAGSLLINGNRPEAESDQQRCSGLEIALPVLHSIDSSETTIGLVTGLAHPSDEGWR